MHRFAGRLFYKLVLGRSIPDNVLVRLTFLVGALFGASKIPSRLIRYPALLLTHYYLFGSFGFYFLTGLTLLLLGSKIPFRLIRYPLFLLASIATLSNLGIALWVGSSVLRQVESFLRHFIQCSIGNPDRACTKELVFGRSYASISEPAAINDLLRPVYYDNTQGDDLGFRLVRYPKENEEVQQLQETFSGYSLPYEIEWDEKILEQDRNWQLEESRVMHKDDVLRFKINKGRSESTEMLRTIECILTGVPAGEDPVHFLKKIDSLQIKRGNVEELLPLSWFTELEKLNLSDNNIKDIGPLSGLTNLRALHLDNNQVVDVSSLVPLTNLEQLLLGNNQIVDVRPLAQLTNLLVLNLNNNQIKDVSPLLQLSHLSHLGLKGNPIKDLSVIEELRNKGVYVDV